MFKSLTIALTLLTALNASAQMQGDVPNSVERMR